jgi:hypothetical protein
VSLDGVEVIEVSDSQFGDFADSTSFSDTSSDAESWQTIRQELLGIRELLTGDF